MKEIADILADAREYIEKNGWWRNALRGPNGRQVCARGAIVYSQGWSRRKEFDLRPTTVNMMSEVEAAVMKVVRERYQDADPLAEFWDITEWNDNVAEDKQEVLDTFMKAEKIERSGNVE